MWARRRSRLGRHLLGLREGLLPARRELQVRLGVAEGSDLGHRGGERIRRRPTPHGAGGSLARARARERRLGVARAGGARVARAGSGRARVSRGGAWRAGGACARERAVRPPAPAMKSVHTLSVMRAGGRARVSRGARRCATGGAWCGRRARATLR